MRSYFSNPKRRRIYFDLGLIWLCGCAAALAAALYQRDLSGLLPHMLAALSLFPLYGIACRILPVQRDCMLLASLGMFLPTGSLRPWQAAACPLAFTGIYWVFRQLEDRSPRPGQTIWTALLLLALSLLFPSMLFLFAVYLAVSAPRCLREAPRRGGWLFSAALWCAAAAVRACLAPPQGPAVWSPEGPLLAVCICCLVPTAWPPAFFRRYCPPQRRQLLFALLSAGLPCLPAAPDGLSPFACAAFPLLFIFSYSPEIEAVRPNRLLWLLCLLPAAAALAGAAVLPLSNRLILFSLSALALFSLPLLRRTGWRRRPKCVFSALCLILLAISRLARLAGF